jgi:hypothetical protein
MIDATRHPDCVVPQLSVSDVNDNFANGMPFRKLRVGGVDLINCKGTVGDSLDDAFAQQSTKFCQHRTIRFHPKRFKTHTMFFCKASTILTFDRND